jgi:hypothetical protein
MKDVLFLAGALLLVAGASEAQGGKKKAAPIKLKSTTFPDETGSIGLGPGWRLDGAYRGTCGCKAASGAGLIMGMGATILRTDHPVAEMSVVPATMPRARIGDLSGAIRSILERGGSRVISLRSRPAPPASPGVPALYYLYEYESKGKRISSLGYFSTIAYPDSSPYWQLYSSYVYAPSERFGQDLPTMIAMWNSWRPNGRKPKAGSESAMLDSVLEENQKRVGETMKNQRETFERMQTKFREAL